MVNLFKRTNLRTVYVIYELPILSHIRNTLHIVQFGGTYYHYLLPLLNMTNSKSF